MSEECTHNCSSCGVGNCGERTMPEKYQPNALSNIKHVFAVVSGKGGVGKSLVCGMLACELARRGLKVGIMDADVTGPSIPRLFNVPSGSIKGDESGMIPAESESGIKIMSANLLLKNPDDPVAWRGPIITGVLRQFFSETSWGELDVLLIDMPPGTSDIFLTTFQMMPVDGIITVSSPQDLVGMIVGKAVKLAASLETEVIGLVENMAYFVCDKCGEKHYIYGEPKGAAVAEKYGIPAHAELPMNPSIAALCDAGKLSEYNCDGALDTILKQIEAKF